MKKLHTNVDITKDYLTIKHHHDNNTVINTIIYHHVYSQNKLSSGLYKLCVYFLKHQYNMLSKQVKLFCKKQAGCRHIVEQLYKFSI